MIGILSRSDAATEPVRQASVKVVSDLERLESPGLSTADIVRIGRDLSAALPASGALNPEIRSGLVHVGKKMILSKDSAAVTTGASLLDLWSEAALAHPAPTVLWQSERTDWQSVLAWSVERQTHGVAAGGAHFRRILFRHAWQPDLLAAMPIADRIKWLDNTVAHIHNDTDIVEPFFLATLWSLPSKDRLPAVGRVGGRLSRTGARLLVALTLYTLVPQEMIDAAQQYTMLYGTAGREIYRDLTAFVQSLRTSDPEESLWLKDAIHVALRSTDERTRHAALVRATALLDRPPYFPDLREAAFASAHDVFRQKMFSLYGVTYTFLTAVMERPSASPTPMQPFLTEALSHDPFDTQYGGRNFLLKSSRIPWLGYMGAFIRDRATPKPDRKMLVRRVMNVPVDERYEEDVRTVVESAMKSGLITSAEFEGWRKFRHVRK